jgi:hypothetical protein
VAVEALEHVLSVPRWNPGTRSRDVRSLRHQTGKMAPRVGVWERGFVGSGLLGMDANGEGPSHRAPACCRLTGSHRDSSLILAL